MRVMDSSLAQITILHVNQIPAQDQDIDINEDKIILENYIFDTERSPNVYPIIWKPPEFQWIKVNTDGASKGNPGPAGCGAVFRDFQGSFCGGFCMNLGFHDAFYAELMAIIVAVEWAASKGWNNLWLESDSTNALSCLHDDSFDPPSELRNKWFSCKSKLQTMTFYSSHIYREGNTVADFFANMGVFCPSLCWWDIPPPHPDLYQLLLQDMYGVPKYRARN